MIGAERGRPVLSWKIEYRLRSKKKFDETFHSHPVYEMKMILVG
jgi:hypothetical protein